MNSRLLIYFEERPVIREGIKLFLRNAHFEPALAQNSNHIFDMLNRHNFRYLFITCQPHYRSLSSLVREVAVRFPHVRIGCLLTDKEYLSQFDDLKAHCVGLATFGIQESELIKFITRTINFESQYVPPVQSTHNTGLLVRLSDREREIADLFVKYRNQTQIAAELGLKKGTVGKYIERTIEKLALNTKEDIILFYQENSLLPRNID